MALVLPSAVAGTEALADTRRRLQTGEPVRVVCFGDSITGTYYHTGGVSAWPALIEALLRARHPEATLSVRNAGVSGHTTEAALARMERDVLAHEPHLVAVMFGMNDVAGVPPGDFMRNLASIVARARARGAEVLLLTPNHVQDGDPQRPPERVAAYADLVREVARETGVAVVDLHRSFAEEARAGGYRWARLMSDAIHPNLHGHRLIAEQVARAVLGVSGLPEIVVEPPPPAAPAVRSPLRIFAMEPFDALVGEVLRTAVPDQRATIVPWRVEGKSVAELIEDTRRRGRWRRGGEVDGGRPDLFILALQAPGADATDEACFRDYSALVNGALSFAAPEWVLWVVLPTTDDPARAAQVERARTIAQDVVASKGLSRGVITGADAAAVRRIMIGRLETWLR
jgi:lysophospholipase L1-like esterase